MEMKLIQQVITELHKNKVEIHIGSSAEEGCMKLEANIYQDDNIFPEMHTFAGPDLIEMFREMSKCDSFINLIPSDLFLRLNAEEEQKPEEVIDTLSIYNPYLSDLRVAFDKGIQSAADEVDENDVATVTAKLVLTLDPNAPDFANDAKLFSKAKFDVSVAIKREVNKYVGAVQAFGTRVIDGRMLMINPDRQLELDDVIRKAEADAGNAPPEKDLMADAPEDPSEPPEFDS